MPDPGLLAQLLTAESLMALGTLTLLEIVLGIDNLVVLSVVTAKLKKEEQPKARRIGLILAMAMRIGLLLCIAWVMGLTKPLFTAKLPWMEAGIDISVKDLILIVGGLFLIAKATYEIGHRLDTPSVDGKPKQAASYKKAILLIVAMDLIFSLDSVITAVGMTNETTNQTLRLVIMIAAVVISMGVMLLFANTIGAFVEKHPSITILALSFLIMIGVLLLADGFHQHLNRGYIYFAMAFSLTVEIVNLKIRANEARKYALERKA
jgi:predicted tellurium resistance membrane protein TerC